MTRFNRAILASAIGCACCTGCVQMKWEENIDHAEQMAKAERKSLFVFYKWWLVSESNRMQEMLEKDPDIARLFQNTINCRIVYEWKPNQQYMARHGVDRAPGFLIKTPDGAFQKLVGYVPKEAFLRWATSAMANPGTARPSKPPPIAPQQAP